MFFTRNKKKPEPQQMTRSTAEARKKWYGLRTDRELKALYKNRWGVELEIVEMKERGKER